jgi:hypothetical protein
MMPFYMFWYAFGLSMGLHLLRMLFGPEEETPVLTGSDLTLQHLKSDYVNDLLNVEQFEEAVARVLRGEGYRQVTDEMVSIINPIKPTISEADYKKCATYQINAGSSYGRGRCSLCAKHWC